MAADTGDDRASGEKVMTLVEHLSELRLRIFISLLRSALAAWLASSLPPR